MPLTSAELQKLTTIPGFVTIEKLRLLNQQEFFFLCQKLDIEESKVISLFNAINKEKEAENLRNEAESKASRMENENARRSADKQLRVAQIELSRLKAQIQAELKQGDIAAVKAYYDSKIGGLENQVQVLNDQKLAFETQAEEAQQIIDATYENLEEIMPQIHESAMDNIEKALDILKNYDNEDEEDFDYSFEEEDESDELINEVESSDNAAKPSVTFNNPMPAINTAIQKRDVAGLDATQQMTAINFLKAAILAHGFMMRAIPGGKAAKDAQDGFDLQYKTVSNAVKDITSAEVILTQAQNGIDETNADVKKTNAMIAQLVTEKDNALKNIEDNKPSFRMGSGF